MCIHRIPPYYPQSAARGKCTVARGPYAVQRCLGDLSGHDTLYETGMRGGLQGLALLLGTLSPVVQRGYQYVARKEGRGGINPVVAQRKDDDPRHSRVRALRVRSSGRWQANCGVKIPWTGPPMGWSRGSWWLARRLGGPCALCVARGCRLLSCTINPCANTVLCQLGPPRIRQPIPIGEGGKGE